MMVFIIKKFAFFWAAKSSIIRACLYGMSPYAKEMILKEVIAAELPKMCIGHRPYQKNGRKQQTESAT